MSNSPANSLTEQWGHDTFQISEFWADYGLTGNWVSVDEKRALHSSSEKAIFHEVNRNACLTSVLRMIGNEAEVFIVAGATAQTPSSNQAFFRRGRD